VKWFSGIGAIVRLGGPLARANIEIQGRPEVGLTLHHYFIICSS
jgi:hypothetical protein